MKYSYRKAGNVSGFRRAVTKVRRPAPYILRLYGLTVVLESKLQLRWDTVWLMYI